MKKSEIEKKILAVLKRGSFPLEGLLTRAFAPHHLHLHTPANQDKALEVLADLRKRRIAEFSCGWYRLI